MAFRAPTRTQLLLLFLGLAPAIWPFSLYAMKCAGLLPEGSSFKPSVFGVFFYFFAWWFFGLLMTWAWFLTWIPTVVAALLSERALHFICARLRAPFATRLALVGVCSVVCGLIFATVFAISSALVTHQPVTAQVAALSQMVLSVGITGAVLGVIVGAWPQLTPSIG
jgi:hypothetical protein